VPRKKLPKHKPALDRVEELPQADIQVGALNLHALEFTRLGMLADAKDVDWDVSLGTVFISPSSLGVEFSISARLEKAFEATISYRAAFKRSIPFSEDEDQERFWRSIVAHVAPVVLMPYVRATFSWLVAQAGFSSIVLPLINPQQMISLEEVILPSSMKQDHIGSSNPASIGPKSSINPKLIT